MQAKVYAETPHGDGKIILYPSIAMAEVTADMLRREGYKNVYVEYPKEKNENILYEEER